ncbi:glycoside hydrolase family 19 protein [Variovorax paradoxus]|nr:glycoside hydrolase family 19 protein [Variovorax paradoxus]
MACTGASRERAEPALRGAIGAMAAYQINTPARIGMFLANVGYETTGLKFLREIWVPTRQQLHYDGRADLGNIKPGDGKRYLGRGWLPTIGRANYAKLRDRLRARGIDCPDLEAAPELLELPEWGALSAADSVGRRDLNRHADRGAFVDYCAGVNGRGKDTGLPKGLEQRIRLWGRAREALA